MDQDIARISSGLSPCQENGQRTGAMHFYCAYFNAACSSLSQITVNVKHICL